MGVPSGELPRVPRGLRIGGGAGRSLEECQACEWQGTPGPNWYFLHLCGCLLHCLIFSLVLGRRPEPGGPASFWGQY